MVGVGTTPVFGKEKTVTHDLHKRPQAGPEVWMERADARLPRPPSSGHLHHDHPIQYRPGTVWIVLAVSVALIVIGLAFSQVIVLAAGLILAGTLGRLFDLRAAARRRARAAARRAAAERRDTTEQPQT